MGGHYVPYTPDPRPDSAARQRTPSRRWMSVVIAMLCAAVAVELAIFLSF